MRITLPHLTLAAALSATLAGCGTSNTEKVSAAFAEAAAMAQQITVPAFCTDTLNVRNLGAAPDASSEANMASIQSAIDSLNATGGGVVLVPAGSYQTGPIELKSNVNLHIAAEATLLFDTTVAMYASRPVPTHWEGMDCNNMHPLIYANEAHDIALTGEGTVDGQADEVHWWPMKGKSRYGWKHGMLSQESAREQLLNYDREKVDPADRKTFGAEDGLRPQLINICRSKNVLIEGITVRNSPFWCIHPLLTENLTVRKVHIYSQGPNSDGCDPESCRNVLIDSCFFDTGDDCIALKSGRNNDGRRNNRPCENIYVRGCQMRNGHGGIVIGSEAAGGCHNVYVENCEMNSPELDRVVRIKTNSCRGNVIENIYVRNITVGKCFEAILKINLVYEPNENCDHAYPPVVQNVYLENIESNKSKYGVYIDGDNDNPGNVNNIYVENCRFNGVEKGDRVSAAAGVQFTNVFEDGIEVDSPDLN